MTNLIVSIYGGGPARPASAFKLLAKQYSARVALFGRKINNAENQFAFIRLLRLIADGEVGPEEAVRAYQRPAASAIKPQRVLEDDMKIADQRDELRRQWQGRQYPAARGEDALVRMRL